MAAVVVKLHGGLVPQGTSNAGSREIHLEVSTGESIRGVLTRLDIPESRIHLVFVGKERAILDDILRDGDVVNVFPPMAGG